jgi:dinuclear metal center YbgI/SA1388 family protein
MIVGAMDADVERIYLSLDIDSEFLDEVEENSLILTHHPLIFKGLKRVDFAKYPSNIIQKMVKKDISLISMHTNFDKTHLNKYVAKEILGFQDVTCEDYFCYFDVNSSFDDFVAKIKEVLHVDILKTVECKKYIKRCALTTGSGGDLIGAVRADCFVSGDLKYHQALEAKENFLSLIDIGHYESERYFAAAIEPHLKNLPLKVIMSNSKNPFQYK